MENWGIWGLGIVGKSVIRHLAPLGYTLSALDSRNLSEEELEFLTKYNVTLYLASEAEHFFKDQDKIIPSPGIDVSAATPSKLVQELDLFTQAWSKPYIAITGSLGKTTLVSALDLILKAHAIPCATGGNIGTPMLDLLAQQDLVQYALLELSSFQLENVRHCAPDLAIWSTFHPNHLDRHKTLDEYFKAKYNIIRQQSPSQKALVPLSIAPRLRAVTDRTFSFFSEEPPTQKNRAFLKSGDTHYTLEGSSLVKTIYGPSGTQKIERILLSNTESPLHHETLLCALAACDILGLVQNSLLVVPAIAHTEHRVEYIGTYKGIRFYNDSKSTIIESTIAAARKLAPAPVHLILGGLSKGIDRTESLHLLKDSVKSVACFGKEAQKLFQSCKALGIHATSHETLQEALFACLEIGKTDDTILLSPGGTSFDLYQNYAQRGIHFKELVCELITPDRG